ncbi:SAM-dependent methyltransferase [Streptomyces virginiae]|uniref:SAM-dependent methyltransferase n=1 Tax=Streptomyces virginiae TaxID=1961 RepID=UPI00225B5069|nr:cyclopropane-fatty-acyl-phospholipid synthase family protein [Streptomyces virginiae]MCX4956721.1 cyclopropane-fatty-acyl-phospholipid synthase family protein [Streptomyces virginiae]
MTTTTGATAQDIRFHYDVGNDFYALWLDDTMAYSAALWENPDADETDTAVLTAAQRANQRLHLDRAAVAPGGRLLDVGCGWGGMLSLAAHDAHVGEATGLTLSPAQLAHVNSLGLPRVEVRLEDWRDHAPERPYDAIVSLEAFEAFAGPDLTTAQRIAAYTEFFARCHSWLIPSGTLSLQVIAFDGGVDGSGPVGAFFTRDVFPATILPRLSEVAAACDPYFSLTASHSDTPAYIRTFRAWSARLLRNRDQAQAIVGAATYQRYRVYLKACEVLAHRGDLTVYRIVMRRRPQPLHLQA